MITQGEIGQIQRRWTNRKLKEEAEELQNQAGKNNMIPIWEFAKKMRQNKQSKDQSLLQKWETSIHAN